MKRFMLLGFMVSVITLSGCAGHGEVIQLRLNDTMNSTMEKAGGNLSVAVSSFEDQGPASAHLGTHICLFGGKTNFDLLGGNLGTGVSTAFVNFMERSGFQANSGSPGAQDVQISGKVTKFLANATGQFLSTGLQVETVMEFVIANASDGSTVRMTIGAGGTDDVIFFAPEDLETLVNEVLQEGFEELIEKTEVKGKALRRKI